MAAKQISRTEFDSGLSEKERNEFIASGGTIYDGKEPPLQTRPAKDTYLISRKLYNSLSASEERALNEKYVVEIID
jgi:hypothetical protein